MTLTPRPRPRPRPGPAFTLTVQVAAGHGRWAALATIAGNGAAVLARGAHSALGLSALVAADRLAYDALRIGGAAFLIALGLRALLRREAPTTVVEWPAAPRSARRALLTPRMLRRVERITGALMLGFGVRLASERY